MVQEAGTLTRKRMQKLLDLNDGDISASPPSKKKDFASLSARITAHRPDKSKSTKPLKTYGKKRSKPLPLTGSQFRPPPVNFPFDKPAGSDEISCGAQSSTAAEVPISTHLRDPVERDRDPQSLFCSPRSSSDEDEHNRLHSRPLPVVKPVVQKVKPKEKNGTTESKNSQRPKALKERRLPVNELPLVPAELDMRFSPSNEVEDDSDPIENDRRDTPQDRNKGDLPRSPRSVPVSAPLSRLRKTFKAAVPLPSRPMPDLSKKARASTNVSRCGDGFLGSEVFISQSIKKRAPKKSATTVCAGVLELRSGPLPDVEFTRCDPIATKAEQEDAAQPSTIQNEPSLKPFDSLCGVQSADAVRTAEEPSRPQKGRRRVTFEEDALVHAQLSSMSAPARRHSSSDSASDSSIEDEDEYAGEDDERSDDASSDDELSRMDVDHQARPRPGKHFAIESAYVALKRTTTTLPGKTGRSHSPFVSMSDTEDTPEDDYNSTPLPGRLPQFSSGRRSRVEVREEILDDGPPEPEQARTQPQLKPVLKHCVTKDWPGDVFKPSALQRNTSVKSQCLTTTNIDPVSSRYFSTAQRNLASTSNSLPNPYFSHKHTLSRPQPNCLHPSLPYPTDPDDHDNGPSPSEDEELDLFVPNRFGRPLPTTPARPPMLEPPLTILRENATHEWSTRAAPSSSLSKPRSLRALTRTVSSLNGTLSQGQRRGFRRPPEPDREAFGDDDAGAERDAA